MKSNIVDFPELLKDIQHNEIVYFFGAGISSALTNNKACSWQKWIRNGINLIRNEKTIASLIESQEKDSSAENLIKIVGEVLNITKREGTYKKWMQESFETAKVTNKDLVKTLKKMLILPDIFITTNYDLLLEQATGLETISYKEPDQAFEMINKKRNNAILHIHGVFDSSKDIDNIVADQEQYDNVLNNKGAQFIQNILGTKTLIFIGCGLTTEDGNISQFIQFANKYLNMDKQYYFLYKTGEQQIEMPENVQLIPYGDEYPDLPLFLEDIIQKRLCAKISKSKLVGRSDFYNISGVEDSILQYHYSQENIPFCGRKKEISKLLEFINTEDKFSWWAITGQAGAGKSRLAFELIHKLPASWFGFFLNDGIELKDVEEFKPFTDTVIIIDYIGGRETIISEYMNHFYNKFSPTEYTLRIVLIERANSKQAGSWYSILKNKFGKYNSISSSEYAEEFLNLGDLETEAIEQFIDYVCIKNGLNHDEERNYKLREIYRKKFEKLQYRPLYVQMFVEAWICNNFSFPHYDTYEDLLKFTLEREQSKWLVTLKSDQECCNSFIRLIVRACISGSLKIKDIPSIYKDDWNKISNFIKSHSFPGKQREEEQVSIITAICQNIEHGAEEIVPMFPDIIKEYMFYYYSDEDTLLETMKEIWENASADFSVFITRCLTDFPENNFYKKALNKYESSTLDINVLFGRLDMLKKWVINENDDPVVLYNLVHNEYEFWKSIVIPETEGEKEKATLLKVSGLYFVVEQFAAWTYYDLTNVLEVVETILNIPGNEEINTVKQIFLQKLIEKVSKAGFFNEAEYLQEKLDSLKTSVSKISYIDMIDQATKLTNYLLLNKFSKALKILLKMEKECDYTEIESVRILAHSCFNMSYLSFFASEESYIFEGIKHIQKLKIFYPNDYSIIVRGIGCQVAMLQWEYFIKKISNTELLKKIEEYESILSYIPIINNEKSVDEALNITWGMILLLKINSVVDSSIELKKIIEKAKAILQEKPNFDSVASAKIKAIHVLHKEILYSKVSHEEVEEAFKYVQINSESNELRGVFFEMLEDSEDSSHRKDYMSKEVLNGAILGARYDPFIGSGISEVDFLEEELFKGIYDLNHLNKAPYKRINKKIGVNELCPCGSGKKFKKCCKGKGIFDCS